VVVGLARLAPGRRSSSPPSNLNTVLPLPSTSTQHPPPSNPLRSVLALRCLRSLAALRPLDPRKHSSSAGAVVPAACARRHPGLRCSGIGRCRRDRRQRCAGRCRRVMVCLKADCIDRRQRSEGRCGLSPSQPARGSARRPRGAEGHIAGGRSGASLGVSPGSTSSPASCLV
jgi:hypothetical protein